MLITEYELELIEKSVRGEVADFSGRADASGAPLTVHLQAGVIRHLALGLPLPAAAASAAPAVCHSVAGCGVRICGAHIDGTLDVSELASTATGCCPPILLEHCVLWGSASPDSAQADRSLDARHSRIARLVLRDCRARFIDLADAEILGDLDIRGLRALPGGDECRVEAENVRVDGSVLAGNAKLALRRTILAAGPGPARRQAKTQPEDPATYALDLGGAEIIGSLMLRPWFEADGGVNIGNAHVRGDCWVDGAKLVAQGNYALRAQSTTVDGVAALTCLHSQAGGQGGRRTTRTRFRAHGGVCFLGARLGYLDLRGARIMRKAGEEDNGLDVSMAVIDQSVNLQCFGDAWFRFKTNCTVSFWGTRVLGTLDATGARLGAPATELGFVGVNLDVGGDLNLRDASGGSVNLVGAKIGGELDLVDSRLASVQASDIGVRSKVRWSGSAGEYLDLQGARLDSALFLGGKAAQVILTGAKIGRDVLIREAEFTALFADDIQVGGSINWQGGSKAGSPSSARLQGASIDGDVRVATSHSLHAANSRISGSVSLTGEILGQDDLRGARIQGELELGGPGAELRLPGGGTGVILDDAVVGRDFKPVRITVNLPPWAAKPAARIRARSLACYDDWSLCEAECEIAPRGGQSRGIVSLMLGKDDRQAVILDGRGPTIHGLNERATLHLDTRRQAEDYLLFFCAHVWGDEGPFKIVESASELAGRVEPPVAFTPLVLEPPGAEGEPGAAPPARQWTATALVIYGSALFRASFSIGVDGSVEMTGDEPLGELRGEPRATYDPPLRVARDTALTRSGDWPLPPAMGTPSSWSSLSGGRLERVRQRLRVLGKGRISLQGLKVGSLADRHGERWGEHVQLVLEGFEYDRIDATEASALIVGSEAPTSGGTAPSGLEQLSAAGQAAATEGSLEPVWRLRRRWLNRQYDLMPPDATEFKPQPYEQLARILRAQGNYDGAAHIMLDKLRIERRVLYPWWKRAGIAALFDWPFRYGLFLTPAVVTFLLSFLVGWLAVDFANNGYLRWPPWGAEGRSVAISLFGPPRRPVMVAEASPVSTLALVDTLDGPDSTMAREPITQTPGGRFVREIRCGGAIEPALYALDVLVPLLDLKQEARCGVTSADEALGWRVAKTLYAIWGWVVTSGLLLTLSGVVRRQSER